MLLACVFVSKRPKELVGLEEDVVKQTHKVNSFCRR